MAAAVMIASTVMFLCTLTPPSIANPVCSEQNVTEYLTSTLTEKCVVSLGNLEMRMLNMETSDSFVPSLLDLDRACTTSCAGAYADWLREQCADPFTARMLEGMCVFTADTVTVGPRCRFAFPDAVENLGGKVNAVMTCGIGVSDSSCVPSCHAAMNLLIDEIGCCYQSLYNDTDFLHWLINDTSIVQAVGLLGRVPEWNLCVDDLPPQCEVIARPTMTKPRPSSAIRHSIATCTMLLIVGTFVVQG